MAKVLGGVALLVVGLLSLPLTAWFLDDPGNEDWIVPVQLATAATLGGVVGIVLPGFAAGGIGRRFAVGAGFGFAGAAVGTLVFVALLIGIDPV